jgi:hypothetical protein
LLTEIDIPNPDGGLSPGIYCTIEFHIPRKTPSLSVRADAIIFNRNEMQVAVVSDGKAGIRKVRVTRDLGTRVEVDTGIKAEIRGSSIRRSPLSTASRCSFAPRPLHQTDNLATARSRGSCNAMEKSRFTRKLNGRDDRFGSTAEIPQLPRSAWFTAASRRSAGSINLFPSAISRGQTDKTSTAVELLMSEVD